MHRHISFYYARIDHLFLTIYIYIYILKMMSLMCKYVPEYSFVHTYITMLPRNQWWWLLVAFRGHASSLSSSLHISIYMYKSWPIWLISTWIQTWMYKVYAYVCTVLLSSLIVHHTASPLVDNVSLFFSVWYYFFIHCGNKISNLHRLKEQLNRVLFHFYFSQGH